MIVSINQPAYLPWLGYFDRIAKSDVHVVLDHVQFEKNSMTNRNHIRTATGSAWLTVPLLTKGRFGELTIDTVETDTAQSWARKHLAAIKSNYARASYFAEHTPFFEQTYAKPWPRLLPLIDEITSYLLGAFGIERKIIRSSALDAGGAKDELVLNICRKLGAKTYISGPLGRDYLRPEIFLDHGIEVLYHDYPHPEYKQAFPGFESHMSAADLLFNVGPGSLKVLESPWQKLARA